MIKNNFLFNFAASYSGGGFKRLHAYAKWFNQHGGASFIIHPRCGFLQDEFPNNRFIIVSQSRLQRLFNDSAYLDDIRKEMVVPDIYYSFGIPMYSKFGRINWFHLSNVLPLGCWNAPLSLFDKLKLGFLGKRIAHNFKNADIISAESNFSLGLMNPQHAKKLFVSVNGSDDEIHFHQVEAKEKKEKMAVVLGTYRYKALHDSYLVFKMLKEEHPLLKLVIIGDEKRVPGNLREGNDVTLTGSLSRKDVIDYLRKSEYYISTTRLENSYNAASEGIFFAKESYISDIGPHRELMDGMPFETMSVPGMKQPILRVKNEDISPLHLKTWDTVISEMIEHASQRSSASTS